MATKQEVTEAVMDALNWAVDTDDKKKLSVYGMVASVLPYLKGLPDRVWDVQLNRGGPSVGGTTTPRAVMAYADQKHAETMNLPAAVLNQSFRLPDGTVTNLAGILTAIHAQPAVAAGPGAVADPQAIVDAIVNGIQFTRK